MDQISKIIGNGLQILMAVFLVTSIYNFYFENSLFCREDICTKIPFSRLP